MEAADEGFESYGSMAGCLPAGRTLLAKACALGSLWFCRGSVQVLKGRPWRLLREDGGGLCWPDAAEAEARVQVDPEHCDSPTGQAGVSTALCELHSIGVCFSLSPLFFFSFLLLPLRPSSPSYVSVV